MTKRHANFLLVLFCVVFVYIHSLIITEMVRTRVEKVCAQMTPIEGDE